MAFKRMFSYAKVDIPNRSGHNVDHRHAFSAKCGTLVPSFSDFLIPGDTVDLSPKFSVQMAPQATDFIGRISLRTELFYVPMRAIWAGWKDFITYASEGIGGPAPEDPNYHAKYLPGAQIQLSSSAKDTFFFNQNVSGFLLSINNTHGDWLFGRFAKKKDTDAHPRLYLDPDVYVDMYNNYKNRNALSSLETNLYNLSYLTQSLQNVVSTYQSYKQSGDYSAIFPNSNPDSSISIGPGSLLDYLGFKVADGVGGSISESNKEQYVTEVINFFNNALDNETGSPIADWLYNICSSDSYHYTEGLMYFSLGSAPQESEYLHEVTLYPNFSLANYLRINNILKLVAYHKIYDDWYRDARLMKKLFPNALGDNPQNLLGNIAYITKYGGGFSKKLYQGDQLNFYDGKSLFDLRQRLWQKDFFTTMTQAPQSGDAMKVQVTPDADNPAVSGEFTIASLRLANAMQLWRERNNLVDSRYGDVQYAQYGVYPSDAVTDRAIYLGSNTVEIYNKSVYQQGEYEGPSNNPIKGIGTKYATPIGVGQGNLCNNYSVTEHGILMALTSIVPEPSYSSGTRRDFHYSTIDDIAFPLLQGVGDQPVYAREIIDTYSGEGDKTVIGYTGRYSEYKFINDHISGLLRDGQSLSAFALQRSFSQPPVLGAEFLEIPENYLDQVSAVGVENSKYGAWIESYWRYSKVSCLSEYNAVPTLGRMPDVHQITVTKAGSRL